MDALSVKKYGALLKLGPPRLNPRGMLHSKERILSKQKIKQIPFFLLRSLKGY